MEMIYEKMDFHIILHLNITVIELSATMVQCKHMCMCRMYYTRIVKE